jgi:hypothetical protein
MTKSLGSFDVLKVPKSHKHAKKKQICCTMLKPNERVSFIKSPESMENMSRSS